MTAQDNVNREFSGIYAEVVVERLRLETKLAEYEDPAAEEHF